MKASRTRITMDLNEVEQRLFERLPPTKWASFMRVILRDAIRSNRAEELKLCVFLDFDEIPLKSKTDQPLPQTQAAESNVQVPTALSPDIGNSASATPMVEAPATSDQAGNISPETVQTKAASASPEMSRPLAGDLLKNFFGQSPNTNETSPDGR